MRKKENYSENELLERFRKGQRAAFAEVFDLLYASVCYYALKITRDHAAAEDIAEDSFFKVWEKRTLFVDLRQLKSYLYTTTRNASLDWLNSMRQFQRITDSTENSLSFVENNAFNNIVGAEILNQLSAAMQKLPPQARQVITMLFLEGKNTKAVAAELGVSQSTVKTQKGRSLVKLKEHISLK